MGREGKLSGGMSPDQCLTSMSDWSDTADILIGAGDVVIGAAYPTKVLKQIRAESAAGLIYYTTLGTPSVVAKQQLNLDQKQVSGKLPAIHTICGTGNGSSAITIKLYFQER